MIRIGVSVVCAILLFVSTSAAIFDGEREGMVASASIGFSPHTQWTQSDYDVNFSHSGFGFGFMLGYAWDKQNIVALEQSGSFYSQEELDDTHIAQSLAGIKWYHYSKPTTHSMFFTVGIGAMVFGTEFSNLSGIGPGFSVGVGYEFIKQLQISVTYTRGWTESAGFTYGHNVVVMNLTLIAY